MLGKMGDGHMPGRALEVRVTHCHRVQLSFPTLWGAHGIGVEAALSCHPRGPSPGGSAASFLPCGAQEAGWPGLQDLTGWGMMGKSGPPGWGPREDFGVA